MKVLIPIADGNEEMEIVIVADTFRRVPWDVVVAAFGPGPVTASRGIRLLPDAVWSDLKPETFDLLAIPGGKKGVDALAGEERILTAIRQFVAQDRWVAAICAGPLVLQAAGILKGRRVTCHPGVAGELTQTARLNDRVVVDGRLITSQGPGTTFEFALAIVRAVEGDRKAAELARAMVV